MNHPLVAIMDVLILRYMLTPYFFIHQKHESLNNGLTDGKFEEMATLPLIRKMFLHYIYGFCD